MGFSFCQNFGLSAIAKFSLGQGPHFFVYVALISPYPGMLRGVNIPAGDYNIATEKLDNTIKSVKEYYEFLGTKKLEDGKTETVIFRFNMRSFILITI